MNHADLFASLAWGTPVERERQRRICLSLWAYAYEFMSAPIVHDDHFDAVARSSDPTIRTGRLDDWWRENFTPDTGQWVNDHPELNRVKALYQRLTTIRATIRT